MSELVKELRKEADEANEEGWALVGDAFLRRAADEIERLQHDLERAMQNHVADISSPA